ncbi:hypothetical protein [Streptomyces sparsogenes]|uniref:Lipoprotein n=1 Tax=Streptomyces sparsogenes DSM 40356 TaxID=1331668 RepID=A0A1R1SNS4_9ACTN|nr:hypothetical protein [Streptomyces sparsogenes]OMI39950.1 hypothetical protein SPAR_08341 [Streptomyces sparsogenes DSM 40356]
MKHGLTTAIAALAIAVGATGCTSGGEDGAPRSGTQRLATAKACADGTYTWLNVSRRMALTDLTAGTHYDKGDKINTKGVKEVARYTRSVSTRGAALPEKRLIRDLARHLKTGLYGDGTTMADDLPRTTEYDKQTVSAEQTAEASGRYVTGRAADLVEADYRYVCGGRTVSSGHVVTWAHVNEMIIFSCDEKPAKNADEGEREAARLGCREGDPARS